MLEERKRYLEALAKEGEIRPAVMEVERRVVRAMQARGYPTVMIRSALVTESRYKLLFAEDGEEQPFFQELLRDAGTSPASADAMQMSPPAAVFNELYAEHAHVLRGQLASMEQRALLRLAGQRFGMRDVRKSFLGGSLYGDLVAGREERAEYEQPIWKRHQEERLVYTFQKLDDCRMEGLEDSDAWNAMLPEEIYANFVLALAAKHGQEHPSYEEERTAVRILKDEKFHDRFSEEGLRGILDMLSPSCTRPGCDEAAVMDALLQDEPEPAISEAASEAKRRAKQESKEAEGKMPHPESRQKLWTGRGQVADEKELERRKHLPIPKKRGELMELHAKRKAYVFEGEQVRQRGSLTADDFYDACRDEIDAAIPLPHDTKMDETIIFYMFASGYEEREIEDTLSRRSPMRFRQKEYGKGITRNIAKRWTEQRGKVQAVVAQSEYKYLQSKEERQVPLTSYEQERARVRDVV